MKEYPRGSGATISADKTRRYQLWRVWDEDKPLSMVIGLNPSTANENENDPTIDTVIAIHKHNGYGGIVMMNLFTFISTDPKKLIRETSLNEIEVNHRAMQIVKSSCASVVFAWGNFKQAKGSMALSVVKNFGKGALCHSQLKDGSPRHFLYCKHNSELQYFRPELWKC
jgi:hypothetical protein